MSARLFAAAPDFVDLVGGVAGDDDPADRAAIGRGRQDDDIWPRADQSGKPAGRAIARPGGGKGVADFLMAADEADADMAQLPETGEHLAKPPFGIRQILQAGQSRIGEIAGNAGHRLVFRLHARPRVGDQPAEIGGQPEDQQQAEQKIDPYFERKPASWPHSRLPTATSGPAGASQAGGACPSVRPAA